MSDSITTLIIVPVFIIIMATSKTAIQTGLKINDSPAWLLAFCVAVLAVIGILQPDKELSKNKTVNFILLPYAALGISILISVMITCLCKHKRTREYFLSWFKKKENKNNM